MRRGGDINAHHCSCQRNRYIANGIARGRIRCGNRIERRTFRLEHISVWVNRGDSQGNLDGRVFGDRFGILETIDVEALFFGPA